MVQTKLIYRKPLEANEDKPIIRPGYKGGGVDYEHMPVTIHDARTTEGLGMNTSGFELFEHKTNTKDFYDFKEVKEVYYKEIQDFMLSVTNADFIIMIPKHVVRNEATGQEAAVKIKKAHRLVHNDYTTKFWDEKLKPKFEEYNTFPERAQAFNIWRRFDPDGMNVPFAVCDKRSITTEELIPTDLMQYHQNQEEDEKEVEIYQSSYNEDHKWYYYPKMTKDEILVFKTYDSEEVPFVPTLHSGFDDLSTAEGYSPRESIEVRVIAYYGNVNDSHAWCTTKSGAGVR